MASDTHVSLSRPALEQAYLAQQEALAAKERENAELRKQLASLEGLQSRTEMKYDLECAKRDELVEQAISTSMWIVAGRRLLNLPVRFRVMWIGITSICT